MRRTMALDSKSEDLSSLICSSVSEMSGFRAGIGDSVAMNLHALVSYHLHKHKVDLIDQALIDVCTEECQASVPSQRR
jgi:hypothetical protein